MTGLDRPAGTVGSLDHQRGHRPEIEGLRAVAVLAVLLFHAGFRLSGGYIGVDVFFVISGFLITRNILKDYQSGVFTFRRFYVRRIRRLFPALAVTLLATLAAGYVLFAPEDMARLGQSGLYAVVSLSNVLFWTQIGYFDPAATLKPLLHTWSLGVEEQFYLLWPAFVVLAARFGGARAVMAMIAAVGGVSFVSAELLRTASPGAVFYLMPFRMFELCAGAVLVASDRGPPRGVWARIATLGGLALVLYAVAGFDATTSGRHLWALLPCVGTVLVIDAGWNRVSAPLLANRVATFLGTISYSLYLVHWPAVVFYHAFRPGAPTRTVKAMLVLLCIALATILNRAVEQPFRSGGKVDRSHVSARLAAIASAAAAIVVSAIGWHAWASGGWTFRVPAELRGIPSEQAMWNERNPHERVGTCFVDTQAQTRFDEARCLARDPQKPNYLILGDSFAADAYVYLSTAYPGVNFLQATTGGCPPLLGPHHDALCTKMREQIFTHFIADTPVDGVVLAAAWQMDDLEALDKTIAYLKTKTPRIVLVGSGIRFPANVQPLMFQSRSIRIGDIERFVDSRIQPFEYTLNTLIHERAGGKVDAFIDVQSIMCDGHCRLFTADSHLIYIDYGHLSLAGSRYLADRLSSQSRYAHVFDRSRGALTQ
jgi:peptidoglycan/LPS O-acetylase OafA/YrhL